MRDFLRKLFTGNRGGFLAVLLFVGLSVRVVFVFSREEAVYFPDSETYDAIAQNVLAGKGLILDDRWQITRPPLYPIFLAACYKVFGHGFLAVRLVQAAVGALACVLLVFLGEELLGPISGRLGGVLAAVYPFSIFFCGLILTETLFTFFLVLSIWLLARAQRGSVLWAAGGGAAIGAATLLRSSLFLFWVFLLPFWVLWIGGERKRAVRSFAAGVLATGLVMAPWVVRNYRVTHGRFVPTTLQIGRSLYEANSPEATGGPAMDRIDWEAAKGGRELSEVEDSEFFRARALEYMRGHLRRTLALAVVKFVRFWNVVPNCDAYRDWGFVVISLLSYLPVMGLAVVGVIESRGRLARRGLLLLPVLYFCLLHMVFVGSIRYRTPVMPFVILFAAEGIRSVCWPSDGYRETTEKAKEEET